MGKTIVGQASGEGLCRAPSLEDRDKAPGVSSKMAVNAAALLHRYLRF
jgi:hypothetical protein